jgi:hypothetical protein
MGYYRLSEKEVEKINNRLDDIVLMLKHKQRTDPEQIWFDTQEFIQVMNISKRTAANWRTSKTITYSQVGNKIYYRLSDILDLLQRSAISANLSLTLNNTTDGQGNNI